MKLSDLTVLFLDLQTTGSNPLNSHVLEIAWATTEDAEPQSHLVALPEGESVPRRIEMITGISDKLLAEAAILPDVLCKLHEHLPDLKLVVIHFAQFEKPFLTDIYAKCGQEMPFRILCTHLIAKRLMPNLPSRGLKGLAGYFGYNAGELKRGTTHVEATRFIWRGLTAELATQNIRTMNDLETWLAEKPKKVVKKYEYPMAKEKRLSLPDQPGVYRFISQWGEVLYVGKATSLHSRVNSYFRGQKNRDSRKLEMLTQAWDLQVTTCGSPLESAILETDEIKRLNPRYNISLKKGLRKLVFFNRELNSVSPQQDETHTVGPFSSLMVFDSMMKLGVSLTENEFDETLFFEPVDPELLKKGFAVFCERFDFEPYAFSSLRSVIAVGLWWQRQYEIMQDEDELQEEIEQEIAEDQELEASPEDIADRF
ncbi:MAG: GIY-YIG nuclease family protein, partial [Bdellovibrionaceae bacterium]|nr:GIY-YIG nuclease family protein [Pseudobdellovibrionaceae bacterium]